MSTRSKFERQLGFRQLGFSYKIPDAGRSLKPFDYVVGVPIYDGDATLLRFIAIEAKTARGWGMNSSGILEHQWRALDLVESLSRYSSWIAIGFMDMPKMKRDCYNKAIQRKLKREAYLLPWEYTKALIDMGGGSMRYRHIIETYPEFIMGYRKIGTAYKWVVESDHPIFDLIG